MFAARCWGHELEMYKECSGKLQSDDSLCVNCDGRGGGCGGCDYHS
jgi:hypothetical protein